MGTAVDTLQETISALAAVDLDTLTDFELDDLTIRLQHEAHRLAAVSAKVAARWETRGVWTGDGSRSSAARLARDAGISLGTARRELRRGRALGDMPSTAAALAAGRVSMDHLDLLARANTTSRRDAFVHDEAMLVEHCTTLRYAQLATLVAYWQQRVDPTDSDNTAQRQADAAQLHASTMLDGVVRLDGQLDAVGGTMFLTELNRLERDLYLADERAGVTRTAAQRRAAALIEMATRSAAMPKGSRKPKPLLTIIIGERRFSEFCQLATGTVLTPGHVLPHLGTIEVETILFDGLSALGVSNRRTFTGKLRRAIELRDHHCQHPSGCDVPAPDCDVDHIIPRRQGGPTSQFNGRLQCRPHNRDASKHDHNAQPHPHRDVTEHDITRARRHWRRQREDDHWDIWRLQHLTDTPDEPDD